MTTTTTEATDSLGNAQEPRSWGDITVSLERPNCTTRRQIAGATMANLRRMNPGLTGRRRYSGSLMACYDLVCQRSPGHQQMGD